MKHVPIHSVLDKIEEVRTAFLLGQRAVPLLEEVFHFLREISPLLDEINLSVEDSARQAIGPASRLERVSKANELATTEILDLIDAVFLRLGDIRASVGHIRKDPALEALDAGILQRLRDGLDGAQSAPIKEIENALHERGDLLRRQEERFAEMEAALDDIRHNVTHIMMSLQVQDITAQQIAAVNHLIGSIQSRMAGLVLRLNEGDGAPSQDLAAPAGSRFTFDPDAAYVDARARQTAADEIFQNPPDPGGPQPPSASQQEIDALLRGGGAADET